MSRCVSRGNIWIIMHLLNPSPSRTVPLSLRPLDICFPLLSPRFLALTMSQTQRTSESGDMTPRSEPWCSITWSEWINLEWLFEDATQGILFWWLESRLRSLELNAISQLRLTTVKCEADDFCCVGIRWVLLFLLLRRNIHDHMELATPVISYPESLHQEWQGSFAMIQMEILSVSRRWTAQNLLFWVKTLHYLPPPKLNWQKKSMEHPVW